MREGERDGRRFSPGIARYCPNPLIFFHVVFTFKRRETHLHRANFPSKPRHGALSWDAHVVMLQQRALHASFPQEMSQLCGIRSAATSQIAATRVFSAHSRRYAPGPTDFPESAKLR